VAAPGRLQGWAATLLLCAGAISFLFYFQFIGMLSRFAGVVTLRLTVCAVRVRWQL